MKKKVIKIIMTILLLIAIAYAVMFFNTNSLMNEVRDAFLGKIDSSQTIGREIDAYNFNSDCPDVKLGKADLSLIRLFTLHNFHDGYIWAYYSYAAYDEDGNLITGSWHVPAKWKIHKENGKWEIAQIFEAP